MSSGKSPKAPKSPGKTQSIFDKPVKGFYSPTKKTDGWSKVSMSQPDKNAGSPSPGSPSSRKSATSKHGIPTVNLDDNSQDDVEALRRANAQRVEEVARRKSEREQAAAKRKSERGQRPSQTTSDGIQKGSSGKVYEDSSDDDDEPPPRRPVSFTGRSPTSSPAQQQKRSVGGSSPRASATRTSPTSKPPTTEMSNASLYSPLKKKTYEGADQGMYSPTTGQWKKVAPKFEAEAPEL